MNYYGGYKKPYRGACSGKVDIFPNTNLKCGCSPFQHAKQNLSVSPVVKNTTAVIGGAVDATTGKSVIARLPVPCVNETGCSVYDGTNYSDILTTLSGPWGNTYGNKGPLNTYGAALQVIASWTIANGGSDYVSGDVGKQLDIAGGSPESDFNGNGNTALFTIAAVAATTGQVTAVTQANVGIYSSNPITPNTPTPSGTAPTGSGLQLNLTFGNFLFDSGKNCYQGGTVQVLAKRQWHGNWGFFNGQEATANTSCGNGPDAGGGLNPDGGSSYKEYRPYDSTPWPTKWLTVQMSYVTTEVANFSGKVISDTDGTYYTQSITRTHTSTVTLTLAINPLSGCVYPSGAVKSISTTISFTGKTYALPVSGGVPTPAEIIDISPTNFASLADFYTWAGAGTVFGSGPGYAVEVPQNYYDENAIITAADVSSSFYDWATSIQLSAGRIDPHPSTGGFQTYWNDFTSTYDSTFGNPNFPNATLINNFLSVLLAGSDPSSPGYQQLPGGSDASTSYSNATTITHTDTDFVLEWVVADAGINGTSGGSNNAASGNFAASISFQLSNPNQASAVDADAEYLKSLWDINDRVLLPAGSRVKVSRNEVASNVQIGSGDNYLMWVADPTGFIDGNIAALTADPTYGDGKQPGDILGAPNTEICPMDFFNPRFIVYEEDGTYPTRTWTIRGYGGWRGQNAPRATDWLNVREEAGIGNGAFKRYFVLDVPEATGPDSAFWSANWWESPVILPSQDFSRPWGLDRGLLDERRIGGFNLGGSGTAGTWDGTTAKIIYSGGLFVVGEWALFYGTGNDGIGKINSVTDSNNFTIDPTTWKPLPSWFTYWDNGQTNYSGAGIVGIVRFSGWLASPPTQCPPFGGRLSVSIITDDGTLRHIMLAVAAPVPIDWNVDLCIATETSDAITMTPVAGGSNIALTFVSSTEYTTTLTAAQLSGVNFIVVYGSLEGESVAGVQKWFFADNTPKNDVVFLEWKTDNRTNGEFTRLNAITVGGCLTTGMLNIPAAAWPPGGSYTAPNSGWAYFSDTGDCKVFAPSVVGNLILAGSDQSAPPMGIKHYFSQSSPLDEQYGNEQWMYYSQASEDALYQPPHIPIWRLSGGDPALGPQPPSCIPYVESRTGYPTAGLSGTESPATFPSPLTYPPWISPVTNLNATTPPPPNSDVTIQSEIPTGIQEAC